MNCEVSMAVEADTFFGVQHAALRDARPLHSTDGLLYRGSTWGSAAAERVDGGFRSGSSAVLCRRAKEG